MTLLDRFVGYPSSSMTIDRANPIDMEHVIGFVCR